MALHVIRDKQTKEFRVMWPPPTSPDELVPSREDMTEDEEYVFLPQMNIETVMELARGQARAREADPAKRAKITNPGRVRIHNTHVDADPPTPRPTMAEKIRERRRETGRPLNNPISPDELEEVERIMRGG